MGCAKRVAQNLAGTPAGPGATTGQRVDAPAGHGPGIVHRLLQAQDLTQKLQTIEIRATLDSVYPKYREICEVMK